jgi:APA family basic amino acid/polyamine antiporter
VNWARLFIWLAIGLVIYFTYGKNHSKVQQNLAPELVSTK